MPTVQCYVPRRAFALIELKDVRAIADEWGLRGVRFERSDYKTPHNMTRLTSGVREAVLIIAAFMNVAKTASGKRDTALLVECAAGVKSLFDGIAAGARARSNASATCS